MSYAMNDSPNPFTIALAYNPQMGAYEVLLQVGNLKDEKEAKRFADVLAEWMADAGGWKQKVQ